MPGEPPSLDRPPDDAELVRCVKLRDEVAFEA